MKRIFTQIFLIAAAVIIPFTVASGQEKKNEQKIKVVIADKDGTKTVIDTTLNAENAPDSIVLSNGKVVKIARPEKGIMFITEGEGKERIMVTSTIECDGDESKAEKIIILGDEREWTAKSAGEGKKHIIIETDDDTEGDKKVVKKIIMTPEGEKDLNWVEKEGDNVIIIKDGKTLKHDGNEKAIRVIVETDDKEKGEAVEKTKMVIAKNGVVVTIESSDEAKAKEVMEAVKARLDANKPEAGKSEAVKQETKKQVKK